MRSLIALTMVALLLFSIGITRAQDSIPEESKAFQSYRFGINIPALILPGENLGIVFTHDIALKPQLNLAIQTGYVFEDMFTGNTVNGIHLKLGADYMFNEKRLPITVGLRGFYTDFHYSASTVINYWNFEYGEYREFTNRVFVYGVNFETAFYLSLSDKTNFIVGLGVNRFIRKVQNDFHGREGFDESNMDNWIWDGSFEAANTSQRIFPALALRFTHAFGEY